MSEQKDCGCRKGYGCCGACRGEKRVLEIARMWGRLPSDIRAERQAANEELEQRCAEQWQRKFKSIDIRENGT